jgi:hypothetical protein
MASHKTSVLLPERSFQPALYVQQYPATIAMMTQSLHQQIVPDIVEQTADVKLYHPVVFPAPLSGHSNRIMR